MRISHALITALVTVCLPLSAVAFQSPGGSNNSIQYNNSGSFGGASISGGIVYGSSSAAPRQATTTDITTTFDGSATNPFVYLTNSGSFTPSLPVNAGSASPLSGVTNPSFFFNTLMGTRQLEGFASASQSGSNGSTTSGNAFNNAQIDWYLNRSAGPPVYAVGPLYNWNGNSSEPYIWTDQEGPYGLTGAADYFPFWGPAIPANYQTCLGYTSSTPSSDWLYCHYMANIVSTATGALHVGHFNSGLQSFIGGSSAAPGSGSQAVTSTPVDSFAYAYTDVPYGNVQDLSGLQVRFSYLTGGINYGSVGQVTNQQNTNVMAIDLEVPTAAQGGGTLSVTSNHYTVGDNFVHADGGTCDGVNSNKDQGCGLLIGNLGESTGIYFSQVSTNTPDPQAPSTGGDGRSQLALNNDATRADMRPGDSKYTIDYSAPYTNGNLSSLQSAASLDYTTCTPSCPANSNTSGVFEVSATSGALWSTYFGGSNETVTTYITAPMPSTRQQNPASSSCSIGGSPTYTSCGCNIVYGGSYSSITNSQPHTYPSGPMCVEVASNAPFTAGQDIRIADESCVDDAQILYTLSYSGYDYIVVSSMRCQHNSGVGNNVIAAGPAAGLMLAAGNDTWSSQDTGDDNIELWMPVIYSDSGGNLYVWQDDNKLVGGAYNYRGRAYLNTPANDTSPSTGCIGTPSMSGGQLISIPFNAIGGSCTTHGQYTTGDAFNLINITGGSCTSEPTAHFVGSGSNTIASVGGIVIDNPGSGCMSTVSVAIGDVPNPYQLAPGAMTYSVYQPGVAANSSTPPYDGSYMMLEANPYAPCPSSPIYCAGYELPTYPYASFNNLTVHSSSISQISYTPNLANVLPNTILPGTVTVTTSSALTGIAAGWYAQIAVSGAPTVTVGSPCDATYTYLCNPAPATKPVLVTQVSGYTFSYTVAGVASSETVTYPTATAYSGGLIKQAHYMTQNVTKDSQFGEQQFNPNQTNKDISSVNYNGSQGGVQVTNTMFALNNNVDNLLVAQVPYGQQTTGALVNGVWQNYGTLPPMRTAERIRGPFQSNILITQPPANYINTSGDQIIGSVLDIWCNDHSTQFADNAACQLYGPTAGAAPFYIWQMHPPAPLPGTSESYPSLGIYGAQMDLPNNMLHDYLNGVDLIDVTGTSANGAPTPTKPTLVVADNSNGLGPIGIGPSSSSVAATWGFGSTAPSGSCSPGSIWSDTASMSGTLYVCDAGTWVAVGSGSGACPTCTGSLVLVEDSGTGTVAPVPGTPTGTQGYFWNGTQFAPGWADANLDPTAASGDGGMMYTNAYGAITEDPNCLLDGSGDLNCTIGNSSTGIALTTVAPPAGYSGTIDLISSSIGTGMAGGVQISTLGLENGVGGTIDINSIGGSGLSPHGGTGGPINITSSGAYSTPGVGGPITITSARSGGGVTINDSNFNWSINTGSDGGAYLTYVEAANSIGPDISSNDGGVQMPDGNTFTAVPRAFLSGSTGNLTGVITGGQYSPGLIVAQGTIENVTGTAATFSCTSNPTFTLVDCGSSPGSCSSPTTLASVTITASNTLTAGSVSSASLVAGDYVVWESTSGTCSALNLSASAEYRMN